MPPEGGGGTRLLCQVDRLVHSLTTWPNYSKCLAQLRIFVRSLGIKDTALLRMRLLGTNGIARQARSFMQLLPFTRDNSCYRMFSEQIELSFPQTMLCGLLQTHVTA
jgi:hypothetical protein